MLNDHIQLLLMDCSGKDFRNWQDGAIIRLFLDTGMRLEGMSGPWYSPPADYCLVRRQVGLLRVSARMTVAGSLLSARSVQTPGNRDQRVWASGPADGPVAQSSRARDDVSPRKTVLT